MSNFSHPSGIVYHSTFKEETDKSSSGSVSNECEMTVKKTNRVQPMSTGVLKRKPVTYNDALNFVCKVKRTFFGKKMHVYRQFLHIMQQFLKEKLTAKDVSNLVGRLFSDYPTLIEQFNCFLPIDCQIQ